MGIIIKRFNTSINDTLFFENFNPNDPGHELQKVNPNAYRIYKILIDL